MELPAILALIFAHKQVKLVDREALQRLESDLSSVESRSSEVGLLLAAAFTWHTNNIDDARRYVQRAQDSNPSSIEGNVLRGWIDVSCSIATRKDRDIFRYCFSYSL